MIWNYYNIIRNLFFLSFVIIFYCIFFITPVSCKKSPLFSEKYTPFLSSLNNLSELTRLKIVNIQNLYKLPEIINCNKLLILICNNNNLKSIPRILPSSVKFLNCSDNLLKELPIFHNGLEYIYCSNNNINYLPLFTQSFFTISFSINPIYNLYKSNNMNRLKYTNKILYNFRYNYYTIKYGKKVFYYLIKKRIMKYKKELLEQSAKITMNPKRIMRLLESYENNLDDI
jgi:Leucine-rich repeat (LRR) protein